MKLNNSISTGGKIKNEDLNSRQQPRLQEPSLISEGPPSLSQSAINSSALINAKLREIPKLALEKVNFANKKQDSIFQISDRSDASRNAVSKNDKKDKNSDDPLGTECVEQTQRNMKKFKVDSIKVVTNN